MIGNWDEFVSWRVEPMLGPYLADVEEEHRHLVSEMTFRNLLDMRYVILYDGDSDRGDRYWWTAAWDELPDEARANRLEVDVRDADAIIDRIASGELGEFSWPGHLSDGDGRPKVLRFGIWWQDAAEFERELVEFEPFSAKG